MMDQEQPPGSAFMEKSLPQPTGGNFPGLQGTVTSDGASHIAVTPLLSSNNPVPGPAALARADTTSSTSQGSALPAPLPPLLAPRQSLGSAPRQLKSTGGTVTNSRALSLSLDIIRSDLKAWKPAVKSSQAALQQITAAKQQQPRQSHQSSRPLRLPSLHRGPALARECRTSPTAPVWLHQFAPAASFPKPMAPDPTGAGPGWARAG